MKRVITILALTLSILFAGAQGTLQFQFSPNGAGAIPPNGSTLEAVDGQASLDPVGSFDARIEIVRDYSAVTAINIVRALSATDLGTGLYRFIPGLITAPGINGEPSTRRFDLQTSLSASEAADLKSGLWYVNVSTTSFPNGEIRGPILPIPEPSTLLPCGLCGAIVLDRLRRMKR
jgi:hypothetical protein